MPAAAATTPAADPTDTAPDDAADSDVRDPELTGLAKVAYAPFGLVFGMLGGLVAGRVFAAVWKRLSHEDESPRPLSEDYSTREVLLAATLQGAIFGLIKTAVDRYGMKGVRKFLDKPRPRRGRPA